MIYYGRGIVGINDELMKRFFELSPAIIRGHAIEFIGDSLRRTKGNVPSEVLARFRRLWEERITRICSTDDVQSQDPEMVAFGSWFVSGKFDKAWGKEQICNAIEQCGWTEPDEIVVEKLREVADEDPFSAVKCAGILVDGDKEGWSIGRWRDDLFAILNVGLNASQASTVALARNLVNRLLERGYLYFRELLQDPTSD